MSMNREAATPPGHIVTVEDFLRRIRSGTQEMYEIHCREAKFPIRILSIDELARLRREAKAATSMLHFADETDEKVTLQKLILKMATMIDGKPTVPPGVFDRISVDEINFIYDEYLKVWEDANPSVERIPPEHFRALVEAVKKKSITSKDCSLHQLRAIFSAYQDLILRLEEASAQRDSSSGGQ